jgi:hypothetical protein
MQRTLTPLEEEQMPKSASNRRCSIAASGVRSQKKWLLNSRRETTFSRQRVEFWMCSTRLVSLSGKETIEYKKEEPFGKLVRRSSAIEYVF